MIPPVERTILAHDGETLYHLYLHPASADGKPVLVDVNGKIVHHWQVELLRWSPATETDLRRGGYLPYHPGQPSDTELWCNCAD